MFLLDILLKSLRCHKVRLIGARQVNKNVRVRNIFFKWETLGCLSTVLRCDNVFLLASLLMHTLVPLCQSSFFFSEDTYVSVPDQLKKKELLT